VADEGLGLLVRRQHARLAAGLAFLRLRTLARCAHAVALEVAEVVLVAQVDVEAAVRRHGEVGDTQLGRIHRLARGLAQRRGELGLVERGLGLAGGGVHAQVVVALGVVIAVPEVAVVEPGHALYGVVHQRSRAVAHEALRLGVVVRRQRPGLRGHTGRQRAQYQRAQQARSVRLRNHRVTPRERNGGRPAVAGRIVCPALSKVMDRSPEVMLRPLPEVSLGFGVFWCGPGGGAPQRVGARAAT